MSFRFLYCLLLFISCAQPGQKVNNKIIQSNNVENKSSFKEKWTIYAKQDSIFHVKRLVWVDTTLTLFTYDINAAEPEAASQKFINSKAISNESEADNIKFQNGRSQWIPYKAVPVLFVQMQGSAFKDEMEALDKRQSIEQKIEKALQSKKLGSWIAGDLGPGGANMLYEVADINDAVAVILDVLSKEKVDKKTVIGRRVNVKSDDWFYEVIYPANFNDTFWTM